MSPSLLALPNPTSVLSGRSPSSTRQRQVPSQSEIITCFHLRDGAVIPRDAAIAAEVPVALVYNGVSHGAMMATHSDLADFALGCTVSEVILAEATELLNMKIEEGNTGIRVSMMITQKRFAGL